MYVIRKRLSGDEGRPPGTRYNPDCSCVETTIDGGVTWTQNDGADPRVNPAYQLPPSEDDSCAVAAGMVKLIHDVVDLAINIADVVSLANALVGALTRLIQISWMIDLFFEVAGVLAAIGSTLLEAAFGDGTAYDALLCSFSCNLPVDGVATDAILTAIRADIVTRIADSTVTATFDVVRLLAGVVGFNNSGVVDADPDADCSACACEWCRFYDPAHDLEASWFEALWWDSPLQNFVPAVGWQSTASVGLFCQYELESGVEASKGQLHFNLTGGTANCGFQGFTDPFGAPDWTEQIICFVGDDQTLEFDLPSGSPYLQVFLGQAGTLYDVRLKGTSTTEPTDGEICT